MQTVVAEHPLIAQKLTEMRAASTPNEVFRRLTDEVVQLLGYEATRHLPVHATIVQTPVGTAEGVMITTPPPLLVPVLRAGLGLLSGMSRLLPSADVGFVGMVRDETTLVASSYAQRLPADLSGRDVFVLDPMLATGGTMEATIRMLLDRGAASVTAVCLVAAPAGIDRVAKAFTGAEEDKIRVVTAAIDPELNQRGYIVPGLGDAGDRLFGPAE